MKCNATVPKRQHMTSAGGRDWMLESAAVAVLIVMVVSVVACSTAKGTKDGTWRGNYFKDPDSVWNAIELTLIELEYEVSEENRYEGVIRAESSAADDGTVIILAIDQVMRTQDQVNVYIKPAFGAGGGSKDSGLLETAADEFLKKLNAKLIG